jgi:hypothetical protein
LAQCWPLVLRSGLETFLSFAKQSLDFVRGSRLMLHFRAKWRTGVFGDKRVR